LFYATPANNYDKINICNDWNDSSVTVIRKIGKQHVVVSKNYKEQNLLKRFADHYSMQFESMTETGRTVFDVSKNNTVSLNPYNHAALLSDGRVLVSFCNDLYTVEKDGTVSKKEFDGAIISITEDKNKNLWIGLVKKGVCRFPGCVLDAAPERMLDGFSVSAMVIDHENGIWAGTLESGLFYLKNPFAKSFSNIPGLAESIVETMLIGDTVWAVNNKSEVFIFPGKDSAQKFKTIPSAYLSSSFSIHARNDWVYLCGHEFTRVNPSLGLVERPAMYKNIAMSCIDMVFFDDDHSLVLTSREVIRVQDNNYKERFSLPSKGISIAMTTDRRIYIGTLMGLYEFSNGKFLPTFEADTFAGTRINEVKSRGNDLLLATGGKGVFIRQGNEWLNITEADGLISGICYSLELADDGSIWVATNKGISHIIFDNASNTKYTITNYDRSSGLLSNMVNTLTLHGENLWVGTKKGLSVIRVSNSFYNSVPPPVRIHHVLVNDSLRVIPGMSLAYDQNNISFFVDGFSFKDAGNITLRFQLIGYDAKEKVGHSRTIEYQNLPPGNYTFRVFCLNNSGVASVLPAELKFTILEPFWSRWWFIVLGTILASVVIWLLIRWRVSLHRKKEEEKSAVVRKLADFQFMALSAQMSPHFTFNVINSIQRYVLQKQAHEAYTYLGRFSMLMRQVLNNAHDREISLSRELETLRLYVEMEQLRFENKFDFEIDLDESIDPELVEIPAMLIQPFVENSIWHGVMPLEEKRKGKIRLVIREKDQVLHINIGDNGIGRTLSEKIKKSPGHKSLGMSITRQRIELLFRKTGDRSGKVNIVDLYDHDGSPSGTQVELAVSYVIKSYLTAEK
jgi:hypothetical protein